MSERPLSKQQETWLFNAALYGLTSQIRGSLPSLERRGLVEKYWTWRLTDAGWAEVQRIRAREAGSDAEPKALAS